MGLLSNMATNKGYGLVFMGLTKFINIIIKQRGQCMYILLYVWKHVCIN